MFVHHLKMRPPQSLQAWVERPCVRPAAALAESYPSSPGPGTARRDETSFDVEAVKLRLDVMTTKMRTLDATVEYARWKSAYRATLGAEARELWQPPVLANC